MTRFEAGDVVRVLFPHVEENVRRYRPALVLTAKPVGPEGLLIWVAMITSAQRSRWPGDLTVEDNHGAGLPIPSMVRTAKVATIERAAAERVGRLADKQIADVRSLVADNLGLRTA